MKRKLMSIGLFLFIIIIAVSNVVAAVDDSEAAKNILVLHSYHQSLQWTRDIDQGIKETLKENLSNYELYIEYMDTKRFDYQVMAQQLRSIYQQKYENSPPDLIITSDDNA
ncbi:MAG: HD domain-containing phosphohydrolase, partial [Bacillota bacterium]